jgi:hypothetical protein
MIIRAERGGHKKILALAYSAPIQGRALFSLQKFGIGRVGVEPTRVFSPEDFKSPASASSATAPPGIILHRVRDWSRGWGLFSLQQLSGVTIVMAELLIDDNLLFAPG